MRNAFVKRILFVLILVSIAGCVLDEVVGVDEEFNGSSELLTCGCMIDRCPDTCRFYVDGEVSVSGDGTTWETAVKKIQTGVNYAHCAVNECDGIDECDVWVAGTGPDTEEGYPRPPIDYAWDDEKSVYNNTLRLREHVNLYGGFDKTESSPDERAFLSDRINNALTPEAQDKLAHLDYPSHKIDRVVLADGHALMDGFLIRGGTMEGKHDHWIGPMEGGAGVLVKGVDMMFSNCVFSGNNGPGVFGGAVFVDGGEATIEDSVFENNSAHGGGAVAVSDGSLTFIKCVFKRNSANLGGSVYGFNSETVTISRSVFSDNNANDVGGAIVMDRDGEPSTDSSLLKLESSFFYRNSADHGGAIVGNNYLNDSMPAAISNCTFFNNVDSNGYPSIAHGEAEVVNSVVWADVAPETGIVHVGSISHSIIKGGHAGESVSDQDPGIEIVAAGESYDTTFVTYELSASSPCIDAANADAGPAVDLRGNERVDNPTVENTGIGHVNYMDIGAVERQL